MSPMKKYYWPGSKGGISRYQFYFIVSLFNITAKMGEKVRNVICNKLEAGHNNANTGQNRDHLTGGEPNSFIIQKSAHDVLQKYLLLPPFSHFVM